MNDLCGKGNKQLLVYLSMGFGNPYGDEWNEEIVLQWAKKLIDEGIQYIALADTIGIASPEQITSLYPLLKSAFPETEIGIHLHSTPNTWLEKIEAAYKSGCRSFDTTVKGYGGCPMAKDELTGNIATENLIGYLQSQSERVGLDMPAFREAMEYSDRIFI
jgi:hydroxymethylglutaryl-CoA lyase